ncbi:MAG: Co2+/Mg2+ efflux protein ApaG [Planctomyces sp.]|nr:Co2+/Mg2+ efflux protein ApaG [Planctomyces sp.]MBA4038819.1 Co2+/Mg2+ efflux protein ApaG [Planctomyces sp.]MBA4119776.1 Co2+/Mg2+ efflux protein ApaG [Isosphaera sp.]
MLDTAPVHACRGSSACTRGIDVHVEPAFIPDKSDPTARRYIFGYRIRVSNGTRSGVQLLSRRWLIVDAHGRTDVVEGAGVIGQQPVIGPGERFEYESFCPLSTPWGTMEGHYRLSRLGSDEHFEARIERFYLVAPPADSGEPAAGPGRRLDQPA